MNSEKSERFARNIQREATVSLIVRLNENMAIELVEFENHEAVRTTALTDEAALGLAGDILTKFRERRALKKGGAMAP
jgi:hypothetical protein